VRTVAVSFCSLTFVIAACSSSSPDVPSAPSTATGADASAPATGGGGNTGGSSGGNTGGTTGGNTGGSSGGSSGGNTGGTTGGNTGGSSGGNTGGTTGGGAGDAGTTAPVTAARACSELAAALCAKLESCSAFALGVTYGGVAKCKERFALGCIPTLSASGTSATPTKTAACAAALGSVACGDVLAGNLGASCNPTPGMLATGAACSEDAQCASTFCARAPSSACGTCSAVTAVGNACVNESCSRGLVCPNGAAKCIAPVRGAVGASCTTQEGCDLANAVGCNTSTKKCIALSLSTAGGACGLNGNTFGVCPASGVCTSVFSGKCTSAAADGAACSDSDMGPHCVAPARCIGGTCKVTDPATCK
jgi:hypothetical protein